MFEKEIPKSIVDSVNISTLTKFKVWCFALSLLAGGAYLSHIETDWTWFARSGALITILALAVEVAGLGDKVIQKLIKLAQPFITNVVKMEIDKNPHLYGVLDNINEDQKAQLIRKESIIRVNHFNQLLETLLTKNIQKLAFSVATLGSFIWGFGDLIGKFL